MTDRAIIDRFEDLTGVLLPEHLHEQFRFAPPDMDWSDIAFALGDDIADQLRELQEPQGPRPIGEIVGKILRRIGVPGNV